MALSKEELLELKSQFQSNKSQLSRDELLHLKSQFSKKDYGSSNPSKQDKSSSSEFFSGLIQSPLQLAQGALSSGSGLTNAITNNGFKIDPNNPSHSNPQGGIAFRNNYAQGLGAAGSQISKSAAGIPDYLFNTELANKIPANFAPEMSQEAQQASANEPRFANLGYGAGYLTPAFTPLGIEAEAVNLARGLSPAKQLFAKAGGRGVENAIVGAAYSPDNQAEGAGSGAGIGALTAILGKGLGSGYNAASAHGIKKLVKGTKDAEEVERSLQAADEIGASTSFGGISGSSGVNSAETVLSHIPLAGVSGALNKRGESVQKAVSNAYKSVSDRSTEQGASEKLMENLKTVEDSLKKESGEKYGVLEQKAKESKSKVSFERVNQTLPEIKKEIFGANVVKKNNAETNNVDYLQNDKDLKKILDKFDRFEDANISTTNKKINGFSFPEAIEMKKLINRTLNDVTDKSGKFTDPRKGRYLTQLKKALNDDIESSANNTGNEQLLKALRDADAYYSQEVIPFDETFGKYLRGSKDSDLLSREFLKTNSGNNRDNLFKKLDKHLDEQSKAVLAQETLARGSQEFNGHLDLSEDKVMRVYQNMPKSAKESLFTPAERAMLESAQKVSKDTGLNIKQMLEPRTGLHTAKVLGGLGAAALVAPLGAAKVGVGLGAANIFGKLLRSRYWQNVYLKGLKKTPAPAVDVNLSPAARALTAQYNR